MDQQIARKPIQIVSEATVGIALEIEGQLHTIIPRGATIGTNQTLKTTLEAIDDIIIIPVYAVPEEAAAYRIGQIRIPNYSDETEWKLQFTATYSYDGDIEMSVTTREGNSMPLVPQITQVALDFHMMDIPINSVWTI